MGTIALLLSICSLLLVGLPFFRTHSPATLLLLIPTFLGGAWAPYVALAGGLGALLGLISGSIPAVVIGVIAAALAIDYVRRVTARHDDGFARAFGEAWRERMDAATQRRMIQRRWSWRVPRAPEARCTRDVAFATVPGGDRQLRCDLWEPPPDVTPSGSAIVYLHGSAWYLIDKDVGTRPLFGHLVSQGHVVMDVAYRLCPETDFVGMVGDAKRAVAWIKAHAGEYRVRPDQVVLMGGSAGAHIALLAAYTPGHAELTPDDLRGVDTSVRAVVSFYGVADLRAYEKDARVYEPRGDARYATGRQAPGRLGLMLGKWMFGKALAPRQLPPLPAHRQMMRDLVGGLPEDVGARFDLASPVHHVGPSCPPTLLLQGQHDHIVPLASVRRLHRALVDAGVPTVCIEYPRTGHAFDLIVPALLAPAGQAALYDLERYLACVESEASTRSEATPQLEVVGMTNAA